MEFGKWIPVKEQLPPEPELNSITYKSYLVTGSYGIVEPMEYVKEIVRNKEVVRWKWRGRISPWEVLAWMPYPEPYDKPGN